MNIHKLLYSFTANRPCRLIHRGENERYLERYWLGKKAGLIHYLHRFVASDCDEWVHDHPFGFSIAIVLTGGYTEERLIDFCPEQGWRFRMRDLHPGSINIILSRDFHRIVKAKPNTWTLFIHRPRVKSWGFLQFNKGKVSYSQPYNTSAAKDWEKTAPLGRDADRVPL